MRGALIAPLEAVAEQRRVLEDDLGQLLVGQVQLGAQRVQLRLDVVFEAVGEQLRVLEDDLGQLLVGPGAARIAASPASA